MMVTQEELNHQLLAAAERGQTELVLAALAQGADIEARNGNGCTVLMHACWHDNPESAKVLLERGADIEARDNDGWAALQIAAWKGSSKMVLLLLEAGANLDAKNTKDKTALMIAQEQGKTEIVGLMASVIEQRQLLNAITPEEVSNADQLNF